jgi:hypothetical protein
MFQFSGLLYDDPVSISRLLSDVCIKGRFIFSQLEQVLLQTGLTTIKPIESSSFQEAEPQLDDDDDIYMPMDQAEDPQQRYTNNEDISAADEINNEEEIEPLTSKLEQCMSLD